MRSRSASTSRSRSATSTRPRPRRSRRAEAARRARRAPPGRQGRDRPRARARRARSRWRPHRILVLAGDGGRLDHLLVGAAPARLDAEYAAVRDRRLRRRAHGSTSSASERALEGEPGELVSLLALHGPAEGVTTEGLAYPLAARRSSPARAAASRTCSLRRRRACRVERGVLLAVRPGREEEAT